MEIQRLLDRHCSAPLHAVTYFEGFNLGRRYVVVMKEQIVITH